MRPNVYENKEEGIKCVYTNEKWLVSIKNWKPDNDIEGLKHLEIHHTTDEQFILVNGKAILITAERKDGKFETELTLMEKGKVYNVPKECWFYSITQKDTKMVYVQDSGCSMENSAGLLSCLFGAGADGLAVNEVDAVVIQFEHNVCFLSRTLFFIFMAFPGGRPSFWH